MSPSTKLSHAPKSLGLAQQNYKKKFFSFSKLMFLTLIFGGLLQLTKASGQGGLTPLGFGSVSYNNNGHNSLGLGLGLVGADWYYAWAGGVGFGADYLLPLKKGSPHGLRFGAGSFFSILFLGVTARLDLIIHWKENKNEIYFAPGIGPCIMGVVEVLYSRTFANRQNRFFDTHKHMVSFRFNLPIQREGTSS